MWQKMDVEEYQLYDATGLAQLVAKKEVSSEELLDAALARLSQVNPILNAVVQTYEADARKISQQQQLQGPFAGVPFLLKDVTTQMEGTVTSAGSRLFRHSVAMQDSALVAAYKKAGFVILGKTNTPEFGLMAVTEPDLYGPTLNPWNLAHTPGGSSGGSAAAVAAGIVPAAQASDGGGSIRTPASCCGLFGLKPSRGRVSMAPNGEGWGGLAVLHAVTRSVRDSAAILDTCCMPVPGDPYYIPQPEIPFSKEVECPPPSLRIAVVRKNLNGNALQEPCEIAVQEAVQLCSSLGHVIDEVEFPFNTDELMEIAATLTSTSVATLIHKELERRGRPLEEGELELTTRLLIEQANTYTGAEYVSALQKMHALTRRFAAWFSKYDMMLTSTLGQLPLVSGDVTADVAELGTTDPMAIAEKYKDFAPNTLLFNMTGNPAMSIPLAWSENSLPIGIQFVGQAGAEAMLLRLAGQLEKAQPWAHRKPSLLASVTHSQN